MRKVINWTDYSDAYLKGRIEHFWSQVRTNGDCLEWTGTVGNRGYGRFDLHENGQHQEMTAHRFAVEVAFGAIPYGYDPDHLCRNRLCINPAHIEVVTRRVNILRGNGVAARNAQRTHCLRGHAFTPENTIHKKPNLNRRICRICDNAEQRRKWQRRRVLVP